MKNETLTALTVRASGLSNPRKEIDMKNVAKIELVFHETMFTATKRKDQIWFTASDLAEALQYANVRSITNLYNENSDEFTSAMSEVIESVLSGNLRKRVRIFSLRGAHLLAMFARTPVAKEFRKWVLDILDRENGNRRLPVNKALSYQASEVFEKPEDYCFSETPHEQIVAETDHPQTLVICRSLHLI